MFTKRGAATEEPACVILIGEQLPSSDVVINNVKHHNLILPFKILDAHFNSMLSQE